MCTLLRSAALLLFLLPCGLIAQDTESEELDIDLDSFAFDEAAMMAAYQAYQDSIAGTLTYLRDTSLLIGDGLAALTVPPGYMFVDSDGARTVLVDIWGNPPEAGANSLGMLFPEKYPPSDPNGYGIDIFYTEDGHIKDDDAEDMDYDDLLEQLQEETEASNEMRREAGYQTIELLGWATAPRYDQANKRLHWAKRLAFEGADVETLNYNILFLGRRGYLTMNVIGTMDDLPEVNDDLDGFLGSVAYEPSHRYRDFDPSIDEVAAYGIGALIAGKVLARTGVLAGIGVFLLKAWKLIAIGVVALWAGIKKLVGNG